MTRYASSTTVSSVQTRQEIEAVLIRYGATGFAYGWQSDAALVSFVIKDRRVKFVLPLPDKKEFTYTPTRGLERSPKQIEEAYEQSVRSKWRALYLVIKAKLEAVESNITTFDDEFLAHIVLPNGETVGEWMKPQIAESYRLHKMPEILQITKAK